MFAFLAAAALGKEGSASGVSLISQLQHDFATATGHQNLLSSHPQTYHNRRSRELLRVAYPDVTALTPETTRPIRIQLDFQSLCARAAASRSNGRPCVPSPQLLC